MGIGVNASLGVGSKSYKYILWETGHFLLSFKSKALERLVLFTRSLSILVQCF
jgi:hypothetical protein